MRGFSLRRTTTNSFFAAVLAGALMHLIPAQASAQTLKVGYSDWPGYAAWQVAIDKGWLKDSGIDVSFEWFDYSAEMDAFSAGKLDAVQLTNGDTLVLSGTGAKSVMISMLDYSDGNDVVIGKPGVKSLTDLKGKKVGVEVGLVDHLLLINGLKASGMKESDIEIVNSKTNELPQVLASGDVDAIACWEPVATNAIRVSAGSQRIYTSQAEPGLIYDVIAVSPASLSAHRDTWIKLVRLWDRVVHYIADPKTRDDAVQIMAARSGVDAETYKAFLDGTKLLDLAEGRKVMTSTAEGFASLVGSNRNVDAFNVKSGIYKEPQNAQIDTSIIDAATTVAAK